MFWCVDRRFVIKNIHSKIAVVAGKIRKSLDAAAPMKIDRHFEINT
jgi:hypothetical protein